MTLIMILTSILLLAAVAYFVMTFYPSFGGRASKMDREILGQSLNYDRGKFIYPIPTVMDSSLRSNISILRDFIKGNPRSKPAAPLVPESMLPAATVQHHKETKVTWFGHSAVLLEMNGVTLFLDPMLGTSPSPFPFIGGRRYSKQLPIELSDLPPIDAVLLSHDHYDHLDYGSIKHLMHKASMFIVPLGVGAHLERWGVSREKIQEHDWWDEFEFAGLRLASTPARHFSGRSLLDRNATLWCSWVIQGENTKIFFSGDSGYGPHFNEIGNKYGPFDLTLMECGQYDKRWSAIHMMPEQTVQAHLDVQGKLMIPIHWAAFTLAMHDWTDPVERAWTAAKERGVILATPRIGETVYVGSTQYPSFAWWR
jgi:L-ascorbate metabolism protein UlaG (beta-lactamase superfamily)